MKDSQLSDFPTAFVRTFSNLSPLRSWTHHSPGTELFLFRSAGSSQAKTPTASPARQLLPASSMGPSRETQHAGIAS